MNYCTGPQLLLLAIWQENRGPVRQMKELIAVSGFVVRPFIVKPFLSADNFKTTAEQNSSAAFDRANYRQPVRRRRRR